MRKPGKRRWPAACYAGFLLCMGPSPAAGQQAAPSAPSAAVERLRIPFPQDDGSLTPYTFELGYPLMTLMYDTLMWRDKDGVPRPWLAQSVTPSPDGTTVTITLPERVLWQDGTPLTSGDVAFTFRHVAVHPHPRFTAQLKAVRGVETPDPRTVVVSLAAPSPGFLDQPLSDVPILPAHLWEDLPPGRAAPEGLPVGSGPYRLVRYLEEESYRFQANEGYFKGAPVVKFIDVPFINDAGRMFSAFELGRADMVPVSLPADVIERLEGIGTRIARGPTYLGTVLMLNLRQPPFDRPEVRRAIAQALDLGRISQAIRLAVPATRGYLHPESRYAPAQDLPPGGTEPVPRSLLQGLPVEVLTPDNDPVKIEAARQVALALRRAGASADSRKVSRDDLSRAVGEDGSGATFQAAIWSASPLASYDPDFLARVFASDPQQGAFNYSGYRSAAFDQAAARIAVTPDRAARQAEVTDALRTISQDAPVVPLFFSQGAFAYRQNRYDGWVFMKGAGILDKRSFVEPRAGARPGTPAPQAPVDNDLPEQEAPAGFPFGLVGAGFILVAVAVGAIAYLRSG